MSKRKQLSKKPLVEAIFEVRWQIPNQTGESGFDPHFSLMFGRMYEKLKDTYPEHVRLPTASLPEDFGCYIVRHQLRKSREAWPLIQLGPGIVTLNDTINYNWDDFKQKAVTMTKSLKESYPASDFKIINVQLRYIDAIEFNYDRDHICNFLRDKMKTNVVLNPKLFQDTGVSDKPSGFNMIFEFPCSSPNGNIIIRLARGETSKEALDKGMNHKTALIWETIIQSNNDQGELTLDNITKWLDQAHEITDDWFFKTIEGDLEAQFS
jgi:uncharacterized protein (TIGR04255 family)